MSSLTDRVRGIVTAPGPKGPGLRTSDGLLTSDVGRVLDAPSADIERTLGGAWLDRCFVVERRWDPAARHGRETIGAIAERVEQSAGEAILFAAGAPRPPFVFFDLETTGLSGGAGTQAFLIGFGSFSDDGAFVTRQFLITRHDDERALLGTVAGELASAGALVSFNGKSFDTPVLETRYAFHRLEWIGARIPHVDVLHPARRFWGSAREIRSACGGVAAVIRERGAPRQIREDGAGCTLQALEQKILGARRAGDVPGFEIPSRYFQFVRTADARPLVAVLEHNRRDLLTLAALTARLLHLTRIGPDEARDAAEALGLGRLYARAGLEARAREALARSIEMARAPRGAFDPVRIEGLRALALAWRRARRHNDAAICWQQLVETRGCPPHVAREATEALAIHHEHRVRDLAAARTFALRSLEAAPPPAFTQAIQYRLSRIDRKINRVSEQRQSSSSFWPSSQPACGSPTSAPRTSS